MIGKYIKIGTVVLREKEENTTDNFVVRFCKENNLNLERVPILWKRPFRRESI